LKITKEKEMADFRKLFLVLAVIAVTAASAFGQVNCTVGTAGVPQLRGGGLTEEVGDVLMNCSQLASNVPQPVSFAILMPGSAVTNRIGSAVAGKGFPTNIGLTVEDPGTNAAITTVRGYLQSTIPTDVPAARNVVLFPNVVLPTGSLTFNIRIANVRVAVPTVTSTAVATSVFEIVSASPTNAITITNATAQVGLVLPGLQFGLTDCAGGSSSFTSTFPQCNDFPSLSTDLTFGVRFTEGFPVAFKILQAPLSTGNGEFTGRTYVDTATGTPFADTPALGTDHATRLIFTMTNVPAGVTISVTDRELGAGASSTGATALNVPDANASGAGGTATQATSGDTPTCNGSGVVSGAGINQPLSAVHYVVANSSGSTVYAVWEVTDATVNTDSLVFGVQISFTANPAANSPGLTGTTPAVPAGNFAPQSTINYGDSTSPIPRFNTTAIPANPTFAIVPCVTNLLFPYVTNTSGYDTGIAIMNTSLDNGTGSTTAPAPFDTSSQTGACTVYFFGNNTVSPQTTPVVNPGSLVKFTMSNPPSTFTQSTTGFEGYVIAQCNFQYAHGFAFIVDLTVPGFGSEGYLALVIPDRGGVRPPNAFDGSAGGEQLIH
jgi:hypothetical protein